MSAPIVVDDSTFENVVLQAEGLVLVDFWAEWCGPCKSLSPILDKVAESLGEAVTVRKVNVDECRELATKHQIMSIPTVIFFKGGTQVYQFTGVKSQSFIEAKVKVYQ